jgi:aryl-alcohol dehydrogenase-like predicted oxidoreductase
MRYRRLGNSGLRVSEVSLGTGGQFGLQGEEATARIVTAALEQGINYFDTADIYPVLEGTTGGKLSEQMLGAALRGRRQQAIIGSKGMQPVGPGPNDRGASRCHLMSALEDSLRRLHTDYLDLYQIHLFDPETPMDETMRTLDDMVSAGKVRYVGASQYRAWQLCRANDLAERYGWTRFVSTQEHYHLLERGAERELVPCCRAMGVGIMPFFPLANSMLVDAWKPDQPPAQASRAERFHRVREYHGRYGTTSNLAKIEQLKAFAHQRDRSLSQLAIAWLLSEPAVSTVPAGASKVEQVLANAAASDWQLTGEEVSSVRAIVEAGQG